MMTPAEMRELTYIMAGKKPPAPKSVHPYQPTLTGLEKRIMKSIARKAARKRWR